MSDSTVLASQGDLLGSISANVQKVGEDGLLQMDVLTPPPPNGTLLLTVFCCIAFSFLRFAILNSEWLFTIASCLDEANQGVIQMF